jgi:probable HAF family extracellular repeat protein
MQYGSTIRSFGRPFVDSSTSLMRLLFGCSSLSVAVVATLLTFGQPAASQSCVGTIGPCFQPLGFLNSMASPPSSSFGGISPDGSVVVGTSLDSSGFDEAFRWSGGTMTGLGFLGCTSKCGSAATSVNQQGTIVGYLDPTGGNQAAFSWTAGQMTELGLLSGGTYSYGWGISGQSNTIVGYGNYAPDTNEGISWQNGAATGLGFLNSATPFSRAFGASANGQLIVGTSESNANIVDHAVTWQGGAVTALGFLNVSDDYSDALAANAVAR